MRARQSGPVHYRPLETVQVLPTYQVLMHFSATQKFAYVSNKFQQRYQLNIHKPRTDNQLNSWQVFPFQWRSNFVRAFCSYHVIKGYMEFHDRPCPLVVLPSYIHVAGDSYRTTPVIKSSVNLSLYLQRSLLDAAKQNLFVEKSVAYPNFLQHKVVYRKGLLIYLLFTITSQRKNHAGTSAGFVLIIIFFVSIIFLFQCRFQNRDFLLKAAIK